MTPSWSDQYTLRAASRRANHFRHEIFEACGREHDDGPGLPLGLHSDTDHVRSINQQISKLQPRPGTCVAIVQCAMSVEASSSTGASLDTVAAVVVVSSHSIGSGLRVIARASTSSMRESGMISSPLLMLSAISTRSLAFSSGMSTVLMP